MILHEFLRISDVWNEVSRAGRLSILKASGLSQDTQLSGMKWHELSPEIQDKITASAKRRDPEIKEVSASVIRMADKLLGEVFDPVSVDDMHMPEFPEHKQVQRQWTPLDLGGGSYTGKPGRNGAVTKKRGKEWYANVWATELDVPFESVGPYTTELEAQLAAERSLNNIGGSGSAVLHTPDKARGAGSTGYAIIPPASTPRL